MIQPFYKSVSLAVSDKPRIIIKQFYRSSEVA